MADDIEAVILVVDDSKTVRQGTVRMLKEAGFAVREAGSGAEALRAAAEKPYLIALDLNMPDIAACCGVVDY